MPNANLKADKEVLDIIAQSERDEAGLTIVETLDRQQYVAVNKFLEVAGAKWNKKAKRHLFEPGAKERIESLIDSGEIRDDKKHFQAFYTPSEVARELVEIAGVEPGMTCLEPSAGDGAIAEALREAGAVVTCYELNPDAAKILDAKGFETHAEDFLSTISPPGEEGRFDRIVMNPPFTKDQDIDHVMHAMGLLKGDGKLVAIMSPGFTFGESEKRANFRTFLESSGKIVKELPEGTFKEAGTMVRTVIVELQWPF